MLAGVTVVIEAEEDVTVRPCQPPQSSADDEGTGVTPPTAKELAGVNVHVEAPEDLTVRPVSPALPGQGLPASSSSGKPEDAHLKAAEK
jgi:hypothetical protein